MSQLNALLARFPRLGLAQLPTPLEPLPRLSAHLGGPAIWVKRDDMTGLGFGGNKLRKLDYVLHEAGGADTLVSGGVVQSNSQRQVAAVAAKLGLQCHLVVYRGRVADPSPAYGRSGNALLNQLFGAHLHETPWTGDRNAAIENLADKLRARGRRVFAVPYGVSNALGAVGYMSAIAEIAVQSRARAMEPAAILHASGSGGTQAGLVLGATLALPNTRIIGIDVDGEPEPVRRRVAACLKDAAALAELPYADDRIEIAPRSSGSRYGVLDIATLEAMRLAASLEGLVLDPVYSAKAMAGLIDLVRAGRWRADEQIVFLHSGGTPALFAYADMLDLPASMESAGQG
ncbi:MAG TPA: D-cysteine desulfhydrase family protein [Rhizomicrobium sp.]|jgi:L-cysteate sulfo-lyase|nr:D-cysteine desulfhydrase family protein [Rhizomicrobium sp.]